MRGSVLHLADAGVRVVRGREVESLFEVFFGLLRSSLASPWASVLHCPRRLPAFSGMSHSSRSYAAHEVSERGIRSVDLRYFASPKGRGVL
jgi:hypothetical protein